MRLLSQQTRAEDIKKKLWNSIPLLSLKQGSNLNIISTKEVEKLRVRIIPQLSRDDTLITVHQHILHNDSSEEVQIQVSLSNSNTATLNIDLVDNVQQQQQQQQQQHPKIKKKKKNKKKTEGGFDVTQQELQKHPEQSFGLANPRNDEYSRNKGEQHSSTTNTLADFMHHEVEEECLLPENEEREEKDDGVIQLVAKIPQTMNTITCQLDGKESSIVIEGPKLEGQAFFLKCTGNITVTKLRGHIIDLTTTTRGIIFIKQLLEAQFVHLLTSYSGRIRALQIHATTIHATVQQYPEQQQNIINNITAGNNDGNQKLDLDDTLARIDIGSLYASSSSSSSPVTNNNNNPADDDNKDETGAFLCVDVPGGTPDYPRNVRVKSNHGYISVYTLLSKTASSANTSNNNNNYCQDTSALVELGGINGCCDVIVDKEGGEMKEEQPSTERMSTVTAVKAHFDSVFHNSTSAITSESTGQVHISLVRKLETDVRLFSAPDLSPVDFNGLVTWEQNVLDQTLDQWENDLTAATAGTEDIHTAGSHCRINVNTPYFQEGPNNNKNNRNEKKQQYDPLVHSVQGTVCNKNDPLSRWDIKARGKINVESAHGQALNKFGYHGQQSNDHRRHLLVVASIGNIHLESLSWGEAIARRYGFEGSTHQNHIATFDEKKPPQQ